MKRILLAGAAMCTIAAGAFALDQGKSDHHDGPASIISVGGQHIEIRDGVITVDGERIEAGPDSTIIIEGDTIQVIDGTRHGDHMRRRIHVERGDWEHHAEAMADMLEGMDFDFEFDGLHEEIMGSLQSALAGLDSEHRIYTGDWEELSEEEKAEVRAELAEAREEIREAMREVQAEMGHAGREMRHAEREMAEAHREMRLEMRRVHRDEARAERDRVRAMRDMELDERREELSELLGPAEDLRLERDEDGRQRIWVDGEEKTGDEMVEWLNRLESSRLLGGNDTRGRRVVQLRQQDSEDGVTRIHIEDRDGDALDEPN
ncbi:hypothetical protein [Maricaulis sp. CAU 1757]